MLPLSEDIAAADGHVALGVDGIVVGIGSHLATRDLQFLFRLYALAVVATGAHPYFATTDDDVAIHLDALGRRRVVVALILSASSHDIDAAAGEVSLHIHVDALATRTSALQF